MVGTSTLQISESALRHNLQFLKGIIGPKVRLSSVVKGYAYGHGYAVFVPMAEKCGIDHFSVFSAEEAQQVVRSRTRSSSDVMIMGSATSDEMEWAINNAVAFYLFDRDRLENAIRLARKLNRTARIHLRSWKLA